MFILGLTGSIGMGKSTAAAMFTRLKVPVHDADAVVHRLLGPGGGALAEVAHDFPEAMVDGQVDRGKLGDQVFGDPARLVLLENILHPKVSAAKTVFLAHHARHRAPLVVLDIPLLFEADLAHQVDAVLVVSAPAFLQRQRVLSRAGMSAQKFANILARQIPDRQKRRLADHVVFTGRAKHYTLRSIRGLVKSLRHRKGHVWRPGLGAANA
ncbi:MAG: dephospho-CoA kinase [Alphaproteobacteria bacterium]